MRRFLYVAALGFIFSALPLAAQRHGGGGGHVSSGGGFASHSSYGHSSGISNGSGASRGGYSQSSGNHGSGNHGSGNHGSGNHVGINSNLRRRAFNGRRFFYPYASYYPYGAYYGGYYPFYDQSDDQSENQGDDQSVDSYADSSYQGPYRENDDLHRDVQTLNGKIDRLQADLEARSRPRADSEPATALVFRDRHVEEIRNYAISGGTLWVFSDQSAKKIPLAQLDLAATAKMNDERGVDFQLPKVLNQ